MAPLPGCQGLLILCWIEAVEAPSGATVPAPPPLLPPCSQLFVQTEGPGLNVVVYTFTSPLFFLCLFDRRLLRWWRGAAGCFVL